MKKLVIALSVVVALVTYAIGQEGGGGAPEKWFVVKVTDHSEKVSYESMNPSDFDNLNKQIAAETKAHPKALMEAEKVWKKDEKKAFPKGAIAIRKAVKVKEYNDKSKADDECSKIQGKEIDKEKADKDRQKARDDDAIKKKTKTQETIDKDKKKDGEREALYNSARSIYEEQLSALMAVGASGGGEGGAEAKAPEKKEEPKKEEKKGGK
jgi:hypothetical protein